MELEESLLKIKKIIQKDINQVYLEAGKKFDSKTRYIDGYDIHDVVQQAVLNFLEYIGRQPAEWFEKRTTKAFVLTALKTQVMQIIADLFRKREVRFKNAGSVKVSYYGSSSQKRFEGFEDVEIKYAREKLSPSFKAMTRMIEEGKTIEQIKHAFGVTSTRKHYKIYDNLKEAFNLLGYEGLGDES